MHLIVVMLRRLAQGGQRVSCAALAIVLAATMSGCATRPGPEVLMPVAAAPGAKLRPIYVATTRKRENPSENVFTAERVNSLNYARFVVAVPPGHKPGEIEWPSGKPDPSVSFATVEQTVLTPSEFSSTLAPAKASRPAKKKHNVLIFVHGFNNNFQESLYRLAQIDADSGHNGSAILFAWPSQGNATLYQEDKDAAVHSRDQLIELLTAVAASPQVGNIMLVAHSMGGMLVTDTLRELREQRRDRVIARLSRVVLAAPDIDAEVFRSQVQTIGPLKPPLLVLVSKDDGALRLSSMLSGSRVRAGALDIDNPRVQEAALKAKVQIVDISELSSTDGRMHHDRLFTLAALYPRLQQQPLAERQMSGTFLLDAANAKPVAVGDRASAE